MLLYKIGTLIRLGYENSNLDFIFALFMFKKKVNLDASFILNASMKFRYNQEFDNPNETKSRQCARYILL